MNNEITFEIMLDEDVSMRVRFRREHKQIIAFVVQLECWLDDHWYPVIRYDTAHHFAHCDVLYPDGRQEKHSMPMSDFNTALTYAQQDFKANFSYYCNRFKEWYYERKNRKA